VGSKIFDGAPLNHSGKPRRKIYNKEGEWAPQGGGGWLKKVAAVSEEIWRVRSGGGKCKGKRKEPSFEKNKNSSEKR